MNYAEDQRFESFRFDEEHPVPDRCANCAFVDCDFTMVDLSRVGFTECRFERCDLSNCRVAAASFQQVEFIECKALGVLWETCNALLFEVMGVESAFDYSSWQGLDLSRSTFERCSFREADFTRSTCTGTSFHGSALEGARFDRTNLKHAELLDVTGLCVNPSINELQGMKVSSAALADWVAAWGVQVVG
jgi:fluoroquinolone resistance protein